MALRAVRQDSDSATSESFTIPVGGGTYRLGTNATPPIPAGWQDVPLGASPVPVPPAPTLTAQLTNARFGMTTTGVYKFWLANRTRYGQTVISASPLTVTLTGSNNGVQLALPAATASAYNPVIGRTLYRSTNGGSTALWVADLDAVGVGTFTDGRADSELGDAAPVSDTSGISPSPVTVVGPPGSTTFTERPQGTALSGLDYTVDYSSTATGGLVTFAAADAGKVVTITYTAATLLTDAVLNAIITAAGLGVRQIVEGVQGSAGSFSSSSLADWPGTPTVSITPQTGGRLRVRFINQLLVVGTAGAVPLLSFYGTVDGAPTRLWSANITIPTGGNAYLTVYGEIPVAATAGVAHAVKVQATISSSTAQANGTAGTVVLIVEEIA